MCDKCYVLKGLFKAAKSNSHSNYIPTLTFINEMIQQGRLELFAGDCQLEETKKYLDKKLIILFVTILGAKVAISIFSLVLALEVHLYIKQLRV